MRQISVFEYTDYRNYLDAMYKRTKASNRRFSQRFIQEKVGASSSGWFSDLVKGRINLTSPYLLRLCKVIQLEPYEEEYFQAMVGFNQAASLEERNRYLQKMLTFKEIKPDLVGREKFEYYNKWYYAALRELLFIYPFRGDFTALAKKLIPAITPAQARKAISFLAKLDFIRDDGSGRLVPTQVVLKKDPQFQTLHWANFQRANLELALSALERFHKEARDISSLALVLTPAAFEKAREEVRTLRKKLLALATQSVGPGSTVYQCNFQIFPVSE